MRKEIVAAVLTATMIITGCGSLGLAVMAQTAKNEVKAVPVSIAEVDASSERRAPAHLVRTESRVVTVDAVIEEPKVEEPKAYEEVKQTEAVPEKATQAKAVEPKKEEHESVTQKTTEMKPVQKAVSQSESSDSLDDLPIVDGEAEPEIPDVDETDEWPESAIPEAEQNYDEGAEGPDVDTWNRLYGEKMTEASVPESAAPESAIPEAEQNYDEGAEGPDLDTWNAYYVTDQVMADEDDSVGRYRAE